MGLHKENMARWTCRAIDIEYMGYLIAKGLASYLDSQDSVDEFIHPVLKCPCDVNSLSFNFSDPYVQKEALQTPVIVDNYV